MKRNFIGWYNKYFAHFFIADAVLFSVLGVLLLFARQRLLDYIVALSAYAEQVSQLSQMVQNQETMALEQIGALAVAIEPLMWKFKLFVYLIVPIGIYLIWSLTQSVHYNILNKKKFYDFKGFGGMLLVNLPFFAMLMLLVELLFKQFTVDTAININLFMIVVVVVVMAFLLYYMQILYAVLDKNILANIKDAFNLAIFKIHYFLPLTLVSLALFFLAFIFLWNIMIKYVSAAGGYVVSFILLVISLFAWGFYKIYLITYIREKI